MSRRANAANLVMNTLPVLVSAIESIWSAGAPRVGGEIQQTEGTTNDQSREDWERAVVSQAKRFCESHKSISITPVVIELTWPSTRNASRPTRSIKRKSK